jgi:diaminopimelate decarboxylase
VDPAPYVAALQTALSVVAQLQAEGIEPEFVDLGGGFGIPYESEGMDMGALAHALLPLLRDSNLRLVLEPGRYLVGEAGVLLTRVRWVKRADRKTFVITDAGMSDLLRPSHYGGYHPIELVNSSRTCETRGQKSDHPEQGKRLESTGADAGPAVGSRSAETHATAARQLVDVVGPICETGDFLARDRLLPLPCPGDLLAVRNVGAYGFSMASNYNGRPRPAEVMVEGGNAYLIRERERYSDLIRGETIPPPFAPNGIQDKVHLCAESEIRPGTEPDPLADRPLSPTSPGESQ